ncbi:hypothetical protein GOBAR_DD24803 [Gossypium barbadense]|nr:hypothetical protein GOBAR_DD24803 [Gossypium barbadense]
MEKYSVIILITILQSSIFIASEQPEYIPRDNITLNCRAPIDLLANAGRSWAVDNNSKFGPFESPHNKSQATKLIFKTARNSFVSTSIRCPMNNMIVSMPTDLYYTPPDSTYVPFIGQNYPFLVDNDTVLEMAYRLNVEGKPISLKDDTGLFRLSSDDYFYMTKNNYVTVNTSMLINYTMILRYTAPEMVYQTTQTMGPSLAYNEKHNLSWRLPMGSGFSQTAKQNADVIVWTVQGKVPIFKDYVVLVSKEYITIHAKYYDVILNGIQVFKLSNSDDNLGKPNLELQVAPRPPSYSSNSAGEKSKKRSLLIADVRCAAGLIAIISLLVCMAVRL